MMGGNLGGVLFGVVLFFENRPDGFRLIGACYYEDGVLRGQQGSGEQGDAPGVKLLDLYRGSDSFPVFD